MTGFPRPAVLEGIALTLLGWLLGAAAIAVETDAFPTLADAYLVQVGERVLWAGQPDKRLPPASLTKVMTALLVLEDYQPTNIATVSKLAAQSKGSRIRLKSGDKLSVEALLTATLIASANDACAALAEFNAGSIDAFVAKMNARSRALGLANTHFSNPCGLDAPGHYSSANDLARIARAALAHPEFAKLVAKSEAEISTADGRRRFRLKNKNALIGSYAPAIGIKSGYTNGAGKCLIALARKDGVQVLLVMLNAKSRWWDAIGIIENAFDEAAAHAQ
ncbi:MAG: D-alanyl-D-alanine carboxypeptidase [Prolixibacteraceae bacterium]|nr:D-alanyl-D-alanine carboxypeptidase [Burkholderiales bacterium]